MKKKAIALALSLAMIVAGCGPVSTGDQNDSGNEASTGVSSSADSGSDASSQDVSADVAEAANVAGGNPWINSDIQSNILGVENPSFKDDFNVAVNQEWAKTAKIADGYSSYSEFNAVNDIVKNKAIEALKDDSLTGHDADLVRAYFNAYLDWDSRNAQGLTPLKDIIDDVNTISNLDDLKEFVCDTERSFYVTTFVGVGNDTDFYDSNKYVTYITNPSFILGDAAEYENETEMGTLIREAYGQLFSKMMVRMGYTEEEAADYFEAALSIDKAIAASSFTNDEMNSPDIYDKLLNYYEPSEIADIMPNYPLVDYIKSQGYDKAKSYVVLEPEALKAVSDLFTEENVENIKKYMIVNLALSMSNMLDRQTYDDSTEAENAISGSTGTLPDEELAFYSVNRNLAEPMGKTYMEKYDVEEVTKNVTEICKDVVEVYREMLESEEWLSDETKKIAIEKLDAMDINVVSPEKWVDYSQLDLKGLSYFEISKAISQFEWERDVANTNGEVDKGLWSMSTLETNAYYSPQNNSINILLGILDGNFYHDGMSKEEMYGGIGVVIGHEISHAFDTNGAQFDKNGNYANWWTEEDFTAFKDRAQKLIDYYNTITVMGDYKVNGENVQTEAIADMTGIKAMLTLAAKEDNFDYQLFFKTFAQDWREIITYESEVYSLQQDVHPLSYLRTNVSVQQFEEFYTAFDVKEGDGMYLAPDKRVSVW